MARLAGQLTQIPALCAVFKIFLLENFKNSTQRRNLCELASQPGAKISDFAKTHVQV